MTLEHFTTEPVGGVIDTEVHTNKVRPFVLMVS